MTDEPDGGKVDIAVDNDVLIKAARYGLTDTFWPTDSGHQLGVLGAARYVVTSRIARATPPEQVALALTAATAFLAAATTLEPTDAELQLAAGIESAAQRRGLALDAGESQLVAMVVARGIGMLETGDKRAIKGLEVLLDVLDDLRPVFGKVRCLEQIVAQCLATGCPPELMAEAICAQPHADTALSICFRCFSPAPQGHALDPDALDGYITALRNQAPRALAP